MLKFKFSFRDKKEMLQNSFVKMTFKKVIGGVKNNEQN